MVLSIFFAICILLSLLYHGCEYFQRVLLQQQEKGKKMRLNRTEQLEKPVFSSQTFRAKS